MIENFDDLGRAHAALLRTQMQMMGVVITPALYLATERTGAKAAEKLKREMHARGVPRKLTTLFREQDRVKRALANGASLPVATYVLHGADDPIVPEWASRSLDGRANVTRRVYDRLHHETHNEPSGPAVIDDTIAWITSRITR